MEGIPDDWVLSSVKGLEDVLLDELLVLLVQGKLVFVSSIVRIHILLA